VNDLVEQSTTALSRHGLILRGGFNFGVDETAPPGPSGPPAKSVLLVGQAGSAPWPHFLQWRQSQPQGLSNPLDTWSREVIGDVAQEFGARAVSPSDRPYLPFQQWGCRAEGLKPSPLGILMHPEYGLWHAYRGALLFDVEIPIQAPQEVIHLCDLCPGKPCMKACPVGAYSPDGFAYQACLDHVRGPSGEPCRTGGCLDRNACPYGTAYRYPADEQAFHMAAFMR
jgi:ferredoxin